MSLLIEYQYFAPSIVYKYLCNQTHLFFEQYESFQKRSFRNRCIIAGPQGSIILTVPLCKGRNQKSLTRDVLVDNNTSWQGQHWKTLVSCYNRSPWFEFYQEELMELYKMPVEYLVDWNRLCFKWVLKKLNLEVSVMLTEDWRPDYDSEKWVDWRNKLSPHSFPETLPSIVKYRQVFEVRNGFIPNLSILDLLFCEGRNARFLLSQ